MTLREAAQAYIDLLDKVRSSPPPPHSDYWHRSIEEAEKALRDALMTPDEPTADQ
jgi:hypothetical protein